MADSLSILQPESLHFFGAIRKLLQCPDFLPEGKQHYSLGCSTLDFSLFLTNCL